MTGLHIGAAEVASIYAGGGLASAVYLGDELIWTAAPGFARQRMVKSGDLSVGALAVINPIAGWVPDGTYPATVDADRLRVSGSGRATITAQIDAVAAIGTPLTVMMRHTGNQFGGTVQWSDGTRSAKTIVVPDFELHDGDMLTLSVTSGGYSVCTIFGGTTWIDVAPA